MKDIVINQIAALDQIVHNPARLMIILLLSKNTSLDYLELMETTSLTSGNITTHLSKLAAGGYIKIKKSFKGKRPIPRSCLPRQDVVPTQNGQIPSLLPCRNPLSIKSLPDACIKVPGFSLKISDTTISTRQIANISAGLKTC